MEKKTKTAKRKQYLNDFRPSVNGEYVYTGDHFRPNNEAKEFSRLRITVLLTAVISAVLVISAGLLPAAGSMNCFYVILPFLAVIICCFIKAWKTARLFISGIPVREYVYKKTVPEIPGWTLAESISAAVTLVAEILYLLLNGFGGREIYTVTFMCLMGLTAAIDLRMRRAFLGISWSETAE